METLALLRNMLEYRRMVYEVAKDLPKHHPERKDAARRLRRAWLRYRSQLAWVWWYRLPKRARSLYLQHADVN